MGADLGSVMEQEIREQPARLADNCERYAAELAHVLKRRDFGLVILAARGSSDHAALYARYLIEVHCRIPVTMAAPSVYTRFGRTLKVSNCLAVGISQSGAAPDVGTVLKSLNQQGETTLAITNTRNSHVGQSANAELLLGVGEERSLPATKTYTASMLALYQLAVCLGAMLQNPFSQLPDEQWIETCLAKGRSIAPILVGRQPLFALGRGFSFCSALEQALKLMECAMLPCMGYSSADFAHGPRVLATAPSGVLMFGDSTAPIEATHFQVPDIPPQVCEELRPIWEAIFLQCVALGAARERGLDPDTPPSLTKVTRTH